MAGLLRVNQRVVARCDDLVDTSLFDLKNLLSFSAPVIKPPEFPVQILF
jgi:hypothetical protein